MAPWIPRYRDNTGDLASTQRNDALRSRHARPRSACPPFCWPCWGLRGAAKRAIATPLPGQQTERFPNGDLYVGQMAGGLREGRGTYTWSDGRRYPGTFHAGLQDGRGSTPPHRREVRRPVPGQPAHRPRHYVWADGRNYLGEFRDDRRAAAAPTLARRQEICRGVQVRRRHGQGTYTWPDGRSMSASSPTTSPTGRAASHLRRRRPRQVGQFRNGEYVGASGDPNLVAASAPRRARVKCRCRQRRHLRREQLEVDGLPPLDFHIDSGAADKINVSLRVFQQMKSAQQRPRRGHAGRRDRVLGNWHHHRGRDLPHPHPQGQLGPWSGDVRPASRHMPARRCWA